MEGDGWWDGEQAQLHLQKKRPPQRAVCVLTVACVLLISTALALLITFVLGVPAPHAPVGQQRKQPPNSSPGYDKQQGIQDVITPRAMLTAPKGHNVDEKNNLLWEHHLGRAFCHGGFSYSNGSLVVPRDGIYRVFLQITYDIKANCEEQKLLNKVLYIGSDYPENRCILSSVDTVSCGKDWDEYWTKSLYTSGLFNLKANGSLHVTSSNPHLIARNEHEVFFGAELLPP